MEFDFDFEIYLLFCLNFLLMKKMLFENFVV